MKQILRYSLAALLAVVGFGNAMAEDVIWQEDWSGWTDYVKGVLDGVNPNYTFTGTVLKDDGTFKSGTTIYNENLAGGEAPELLVAKNGGSFTATVDLGGKSGDMTLSFKCNKNIPVEVTGGTIGEKTGTGNDYVYAISGASGTLTIKFGSVSANARLDNIKLSQGQGKKPAGLSWGTSARTVTIGADDNVFPTLSNENGLDVTYNSSETSVATIAADGTITLVAAGSTVITASSEETAEFEAGNAQYTLTVKEAAQGGGGDEQQEITVASALEIINGLEDGAKTSEVYQVKGFVVGDPDFQRKADGSLYGNVNFTMADEQNGTTLLTAYRCKDLENVNFTEETINRFKAGDQVVVQGKLQKYVKDGVMTPELTSCYLISVKAAVTAAVTITAAGYATYVNTTNALDFSGTGIKAYTAQVNGNYVDLTEITKVPANTPVVLYKAGGADVNVPITDTPDVAGINQLEVSNGSVTGGDGIYALAEKNSVVGFYKVADTVTIPAGKCYLNTSADAPDYLGFSNDVTGIDTVKGSEVKVNGEFYNLAGQRVAQPTKGLYIMNGKKVILK